MSEQKEYIERGEATKTFREMTKAAKTVDMFVFLDVIAPEVIEAIPAADVEPVVRGGWVKYKYESGREAKFYMCSVCEMGNPLDGERNEWFPNFCPHCGAHMLERIGER